MPPRSSREGCGGRGDSFAPSQDLASFSKSHFIGDHGSLAKSEMEHTLALIGKKREQGLVGGIFAGLDPLLVISTQLETFAFVLQKLQEKSYFLRDAKIRVRDLFRLGQDLEGIFAWLEQTGFVEIKAEAPREITPLGTKKPQGFSGMIHNEITSRAAILERLFEEAGEVE